MPEELHEHICDEKRYANIYNKYAKDLNNFLYYKFGSQFNPSDKVQEAFIKLWNNCAKVPPSKAKSYLFTVGNNMMLNEVKHQKVKLNYQPYGHSILKKSMRSVPILEFWLHWLLDT